MHALTAALRTLGEFVVGLRWDAVDAAVRRAVQVTLLDTLGVTVAGARTPEMRRLVECWEPPTGPARLSGTRLCTTVDTAALINGTAACCLELDEGNKYARGHPAAHVFPAALALSAVREVPGEELCSALLAGHEVASRFGRAFSPVEGLHPHGHWGAIGAAAASARLLGLDAGGVAGALDAAAGLPLATSFGVALRGTFVRNMWIGAANVNGLVAARLAAAGLATVDGTAALTLGRVLGQLDTDALTSELGTRFDVTRGYFKRHASCSYTHPPADAVLELRRRHPELRSHDVAGIDVATHRLAAPLDGTDVPTRLAAMFSVPYVVAAALTAGACPPAAFDDAHRTDPEIRRLMRATTVRRDDEMDGRLPGERPARVTVRLRSGEAFTAEVPNPVGDADHHPLGRSEILEKLTRLIGHDDAETLAQLVDALPEAPETRELLGHQP